MDDYNESDLGLKEVERHAVTMDFNYSPDESLSYYAYATYSYEERDQAGRSHNPVVVGSISDTTRNWALDFDDKSFTVGAGARFSFWGDKLTWDTEYTFSGTNTGYALSAGSDSAVADPEDLPDLKTFLHSFSTTGQYRLTQEWSVGVNYLYENFSMDDFSMNDFDPLSVVSDSLREVILLGGSIQDYEAHAVMLFVDYQFGN